MNPIQIPLSEKRLVQVSTSWDGSLDVNIKAKPTSDSDWQFEHGFNIDKPTATALAVILLERSESAHMLMKKHRP